MSDSQNNVKRLAEYYEKISQNLNVYNGGHEVDSPISGQYYDDRIDKAHSRHLNTTFNTLNIETVRPLSNEQKKSENEVHRKCRSQLIENSLNIDGKMESRRKEIDSEVTVSPVSGQENISIELSVHNFEALSRPISCSSHSSSESENNWKLFRASCSSAETGSVESSNQLTNTIEELLFNEDTYIRALIQGIEGYMKNFNRPNMPADLRGQMNRVFGNVLQIKYFHENIFYPALKECMMDIIKICKTFCIFIEQDCFYIYILYAINRQKSDKICEAHRNYFKQIQNEIGDKLGVNSFLVQPIQRLPKYKLLLGQLFLELKRIFVSVSVHDDRIKNEIAACCLAEKQLQRLLDTVNGSMNINDIVDCTELHPLCQGKFKLVDKFDITEKGDLRRRYKGKVFLFEKCIIYSEISYGNRLLYRGHFRQATLGFTFDCQRNYFRLYNERKGQQDVEFSTDPVTLQLWLKMLDNTMAPVVLHEKQKIEDNRRIKLLQSMLQISPDDHSDSVISTGQTENCDFDLNTFQNASKEISEWHRPVNASDSSAYDSISMNRSTDSQSRKSIWYTEFDDERKIIERFLNSEKYYIQLVKNGITEYLSNLPESLGASLSNLLVTMKKILDLHENQLYPHLLECNFDAGKICSSIRLNIHSSEFRVYFEYAAHLSEALENLFRTCDLENSSTIDEKKEEMESLLQMPLNRVENYFKFTDDLLSKYKNRDLFTEDFRIIAKVQIEMDKFRKGVSENFRLNSMKSSTMCAVRQYGLISYSDEITIDLMKCRLLILERGLMCIRIKISTKTKKEKFLDEIFAIPLANIELHENDAYPLKIRILVENVQNINYTISFTTKQKKKHFMDAIRTQRNFTFQI